MIHITDSQSDVILAAIAQSNVLENVHRQSLEDYLETFEFIAFGDREFVNHLSKRNRIIIPDEDDGYREFIIHELIKEKGGQHRAEVYAVGSYFELRKAKVIDPIVLSEYTPTMHVSFATNETEWRPGIIEGSGYRTKAVSTATNPLEYLKQIANEFELELRFRVETDGNKVTGRYVDLLDHNGDWRGREITFGKDLQRIRRREDNANIYTALKGLGPEREDGTRLEVFVEDRDALQRWGRRDPLTGKLRHLVDVYEPISERTEMTEEELIRYTRTELNKRINSVVEYEVDVVDLENVPGMENKRIRFGDTIRIKDEKFNPALYLEARVHTQERDIFTKANKKIGLGDYTEYTEEEVNEIWKQLQKAIQRKISMSDLLEVTYTKELIDQKDVPGNQAKDKLDREVGEAVIETTTGSSEKAQEAENNAKDYVDLREIAINQKILEKADLTYVDGQLAYKADSEVVQAINNTVDGLEQTTSNLLQSVADNADALEAQGGRITTVEADLDEVEGQLSVALSELSTLDGTVSQQGTQISANTEAISLKAEQSEVEGLQEELDGLSFDNRNLVKDSYYDKTTSDYSFTHRQLYVQPSVGEEVTVSARGRVIKGESDNWIRIHFVKVNNPESGNGWVQSYYFEISSTELETKSMTVTVPESEGEAWVVHTHFFPLENEGTDREAYVEWVKVEKGSKATSYSRAPEDIIADIDAVGSRVTNVSAELEVLAGEVSAKAERSELESLEGNVTTISNDLASLSVAYDGITADIQSIEATTDGLTTDISNLNTDIQAVAGEVNSKVSAEYVTGAIADIEIGGRNYYSHTNRNIVKTGGGTLTFDDNETPYGFYSVGDRDQTIEIKMYDVITSNGFWTVSFDMRGSQNSTTPGMVVNINGLGEVSFPRTLDNKYRRVSLTVEVTNFDEDNPNNNFVFFKPSWNYYWVKNIKVEKGNKVTDWSPAPEDVQAEIDSVYEYASSEFSQLPGKLALKADATVVDGVESRVTTAELNIDALEGAITSKVSEGDVRSIFTQEASSFTFDADQINFNGHVFGQNATFEGDIVGASITGSSFYTGGIGHYLSIEGPLLIGSSNYDGYMNTFNISAELGFRTDRVYNQTGTLVGQVTVDSYGISVLSGSVNLRNTNINIRNSNNLLVGNIRPDGTNNRLLIDGITRFSSAAIFDDGASLHDKLTVSAGGINVTGGATINGGVGITGNLNLGGSITGGLRVNGATETTAVDTTTVHMYGRPSSSGEFRVTRTGSTSVYRPVRAYFFHNEGESYTWAAGARIYLSSNQMYLQADSQVRATKYLSGTLVPMYASSFNDGSLESTKDNISPLELNALDILNNQADLWEYNLKSELEDGVNRKRIGFVIGEGYKTPEILLSSDGEGIEGYAHRTLNTKAIKELSGIVFGHSDDINFLRMEIQYLRGVIEQIQGESE